jgi:hypothetical protein
LSTILVRIADGIAPLWSLPATRHGDLADLVTTEHPDVNLSDMTLAPG